MTSSRPTEALQAEVTDSWAGDRRCPQRGQAQSWCPPRILENVRHSLTGQTAHWPCSFTFCLPTGWTLPSNASQGQTDPGRGMGGGRRGDREGSGAPRSQKGWRHTVGQASGTEAAPAQGTNPGRGFQLGCDARGHHRTPAPPFLAVVVRDLEKALHCVQPGSESYLRRTSVTPPNPPSQCVQLTRDCPLPPATWRCRPHSALPVHPCCSCRDCIGTASRVCVLTSL